MTSAITRGLLEHYLRAIAKPMLAKFTRAMDAGLPVRDVVQDLCMALELPYQETCFRLGLCAAAEEMTTDAAAWTFTADELTRDGAHQLATYARAQASMISEYVQRHLHAAGIDPAAWEKTRRP